MGSRSSTARLALGLALCLAGAACEASLPGELSEPRFEGRVVLRGDLVHAENGAVRVDVWRDPDDLMPLLSRRYALGDAAFVLEGEDLVLRFELDARHRLGGGGHEPCAATAIEACFEPRGLLADALGGDVTARAPARPDGDGIELVLAPRAVLYDGDLGD